MEIYRKENKICFGENENAKPIEEYDFIKEINFQGLMEFLLKKNLNEKVEITKKIEDPTNEEKNLIKVIESLIHAYNDRVDDLLSFKKTNLS